MSLSQKGSNHSIYVDGQQGPGREANNGADTDRVDTERLVLRVEEASRRELTPARSPVR